MINKQFLLLSLLAIIAAQLTAQDGTPIPFSSPKWNFAADNYEITEYLGRESLHFTGQSNQAYLPDANFKHGTLEFDVALPDKRTFLGFMFRMQDPSNYEEFYFRPHQSGNPDAYQYSPVFNGLNGWQLYTGPGYSQAVPYHYDNWMHVKLVVAGTRAEIYLNGAEEPAIYLPHLMRDPIAGGIGLWGRDGYFADFKFTPMDTPPALKNEPVARPERAAGTISSWQVSNPFPESVFDDQMRFPSDLSSGLQWKSLQSENSGTTNLARLAGVSDAGNTVFAKITIRSDRAQTKALRLGYSDRVYVYLNNQPLYAGQYNFRDRDYRFLGTIGYFDVLFLPLQKGDNELWIAVSENFGGWAIRGQFLDEEGITYR